MPDFGFDPIGLLRIQLENQKNNSPLDAFTRGMNQGTDLRSKQTDLAEKQANLSSMLYGQQQQRSLADVARQNQGAFNSPLARGLAGVGNLGAANEAEQADVARQKLRQQIVDIHTDVTRSRLRAAKTPDQIDNVLSSTDEGVRNLYGLPQSSKDEGAQDKINGFISAGLGQKDQGELENKQAEIAIKQQLADRNRIFNGKNGETISFDPNTGEAITLRGPPPAKVVAGGAGSGVGAMKPTEVEKQFGKLTQAVSTVQGRGNLNKDQQERLNAADRLEALVLGPGGQIQNLTPQQVREAGTALANLISKGAMSLGQIEELTPHTMAGNFANVKQKLLNEPEGADAQKFLQNMLDTAGREKAVTLKQLRAGQAQALGNYAHLRKADAGRYDAILKGAGLNPSDYDENGLQKSGAGPSAAYKLNPGEVLMYSADGAPHGVPQDKAAEAEKTYGFKRAP